MSEGLDAIRPPEKLSTTHNLLRFDSGEPVLDDWLRRRTLHNTFHGIESEALLILLDKEGICASSGSACLADSDEPSHVLKAMNPKSAASRQMIRFSFGAGIQKSDVAATLQAVQRTVNTLRG